MTARLLVVDGEPDALHLLEYSLSAAGFQVATAQIALELLRKARKYFPDLIVLDIVLPDMDGFTVCELLRAQPSTARTPVLPLSSHSGMAIDARGQEAGVVGCLCKTIGPKRIAEEISRVLANRIQKNAQATEHEEFS